MPETVMAETLMHTLPTKKAEKYAHKHGKDHFLLILNSICLTDCAVPVCNSYPFNG